MKKLLTILLLSFTLMLSAQNSGDKLYYEENKGQWNSNVLYKLSQKNIEMYYENKTITFLMYDFHELLNNNHPKSRDKVISDNSTAFFHSYKIDFIGASKSVSHKSSRKIETYHNYFIGNDPAKWKSNVRLFEELVYENIYPGINIKVYSQNFRPKHDFIVKAGADASKINMKYTGVNKLDIKNDDLIVTNSLGTITEQKPYAFQIIGGRKVEVLCKYVLVDNSVSFSLPNGYDSNYELVIDPILIGSTYSGSTSDNWGCTATYDNNSNMYAGGIATTVGYPTTLGAYQVNFAGGGVGGVYPYPWDIAITKYNTTGSAQIFATYLGGAIENDYPHSMVVNGKNELYVYGKSYSTDYPTTTTAYDKTLNGNADLIITKFNSTGTALLGSTFVGGSADDGVNFDAYELIVGGLKFNYGDDARGEIIVDQIGNCYVASVTKSSNFPVTVGAYQTAYGGGIQDACVFKLDSNMANLNWSTFLGGSLDDAAYGLALDNQNNVYTAGGTLSSNFPVTSGVLNATYKGLIDGFVSKIKNDGSALLASTFIGTTSYDQCYFVQTDKSNNVYVYGQSQGVYPTTSGIYKSTKGGLFIHKLNSALTTTVFSTIIGDGVNTSPNISPSAFLVDNCENIYISGWGGNCGTPGGQGNTTGMPVTVDAQQPTTDGCDFYLLSLSKNALILNYATFFGGTGYPGDHVDGGTSRFDKRGVVYQSVCASCSGDQTFPTSSTAWSKTNKASNCNNAVFKIDFETPNVTALASTVGVVGCVPLTYTFTNGSANATSYIWDFGDGSPIDTTYAPSHTYTVGGTYNVKVIAINPLSCNGSDSATVPVTVKPGPYIQFGPDIDMVCDTVVSFTLDAGNAGSTFLWSTGETTQVIAISDTGVYWVSATFSGCTSIDTIIISGSPPANAKLNKIPNVFTPNGDQLNDKFDISANGVISNYSIKIYDRWGLLMYESNDINNSWDGKHKGKEVPSGTYYFIVSFDSTCISNPVKSKGSVMLLR